MTGERLCPFGDGRHKRKVWSGKAMHTGEIRDGRTRSGLVCVNCSKTWEWHGGDLRPTWAEAA